MRMRFVMRGEWAPFCLLLCVFCDRDLLPMAVVLFFATSSWGD